MGRKRKTPTDDCAQRQHSAPNTIMSLTVVKYSWSTGQNEHGASQWNHVYRDDLCLVFDDNSPSSSSVNPQLMKVFQGSEVVELVPLERLIQLSQKARNDTSQHMVQVLTEQLPIHALYRRSTCNIAFKYRTEDGQLRRNQFKFRSVPDFDMAMDYLNRIGCPLLDSAPKHDVAPQAPEYGPASLAAASRPSTSTSLLGQRQPTSSGSQSVLRSSEFQTAFQGHFHSSVSPVRQFEASHQGDLNSKGSTDMPPPRLSLSAGQIDSSDSNAAYRNRGLSNVSRHFTSEEERSRRPATAPIEHHVDYISQTIPARRELPFKSSSSRLSSSGKAQGTRSSSAVQESPRLPEPEGFCSSKPAPSTLSSNRNIGSQAVSANLGPSTSSLSAPGCSSSPPPPGRLSARQGEQAAASAIEGENSLAGYAAQTEGDRMDALESMICGLIYDDDFLKLSEDVEACWRRIGLAR